MKPALMLAWELYARQRWLVTGIAIGLVLAWLALPLLPFKPGVLGMPLAVWVLAPLLVIVGNLAHGYQGRLEDRPSLFPRRLLLLPVSSLTLALPPLLASSLLSLVAWQTMSLMSGAGQEAPPPWVGLLLAALAAILQALCWLPLPLPWLRLVLIATLLPATLRVPVLPSGVAEAVLLSLTTAGYLAAITGVSLARRGTFLSDPTPALPTAERRPMAAFATPAVAQSWLEWRLHGWQALFLCFMTLFWLLPLMFLVSSALDKDALYLVLPWLRPLADAVGKGGVMALLPLAMPMMVVLTSGASIAQFTRGGPPARPPLFMLARPLGNGHIIAAKVRFATELLALAWGMSILLAVGWVAVEGLLGNTALRLAATFGPLWWLMLTAALAAAFAISVMWLASGLWAGFRQSTLGSLSAILAVFALPTGLYFGWGWLIALAIAVDIAPMLGILRGWRFLAALAAATTNITAALWGWPVVLLLLLLWPVPGLLAARPALDRARAG